MRRPGLRPLSVALREAAPAAAPATLLARVQTAWPRTAGHALATAARPVAERDGVVTMACESAAWAQELELLAPALLTRLNERLGTSQEGQVDRLRFVVGSAANHS